MITLFPDMMRAVLGESILGRAEKAGHLEIHYHQIRDYSTDRHHNVDDTPYGGGYGMLLTCQPIGDCHAAVLADLPVGTKTRTVYMSPKGRLFTHEVAKELAAYDNLIFICGHYEGVDQRVLDETVDDEISIGDFVVTGGEIPACIVADAVARLTDGVLKASDCYEDESVVSGLLEYPQYTKPRVWHGREVPDVLLDGDHGKVERWRLEQSVALTRQRRPDLLEKHPEWQEKLRQKPQKADGNYYRDTPPAHPDTGKEP